MAKKLIDQDEAARTLGINTDQLTELRERFEISGYRDGSGWKFKHDDVERLAKKRREEADAEDAEFSELGDDNDSIMISEVELGQSPGTSSTVIGKIQAPNVTDDDLQIAKPGSSDLHIGSGMSDVKLAGESDVLSMASGLSSKFDDLDTLDLDLPSPGESDLTLVSGSGPQKPTPNESYSLEGDDLALDEDPSLPKLEETSGGSDVDLAGDDDGELVLGGSGPGSDLTHSAGDSGISLVDPADSGLSLAEMPLQLGGSGVEPLELGEDEDMIVLEEEEGAEAIAELQADDDFMLTPLSEEQTEDSDSGSQVIALDSEADFDENAATMLGGAPAGLTLDDELGGVDLGGGPTMMPGGAGFAAGTSLMPSAASREDVAFSGWSVAFMSVIAVTLMLGGMMTYDLMRNMWSWNGAYRVNSSLMNPMMQWFEK
jgi:hypothetical protein